LPVAVYVHLGKGLTQRSDLVLRNTRCDETQGRTLQLHCVHVVLHVDEDIFVDFYVFKFFVALLLNPRVLVGLLCCQPHVSLALEQLGYQVLC
jgi:hypothetical protein